MKQPLVSVHMITYNHELFIAQAIEGVLIQKTTFRFELVISDDCSKDGTPKIISRYASKYPDIIKPIYRDVNIGSLPNFMDTFMYCTGKYIALCEGDDFWTDPYKLQKQVDFLDANEDFGMIYTNVDKLIEKNKKIEKNIFSGKSKSIKNTFEDFLINGWFLAPCTWVIRVAVLEVIEPNLIENYTVGDLPILLGISKNSRIAYLNDSTAVYRVLDSSASHFKAHKKRKYWEFRKGTFDVQMNFAKYYDVSQDIIFSIKKGYYLETFTLICLLDDKNSRKEAFSFLKKTGIISNKQKLIFFLASFSLFKKLTLKIYKD